MQKEGANFIHLHTHSHYSLLDGLTKVETMVEIAKKHKMNAIAITDHGNMYGAIEFYKEAQKNGIKPIIGCEVYVAERKMTDKEPGLDNKRYHLILLAKNRQGYKNLMKIVSEANLKGYYYKPRVDMDLLKQYGEGLIALSGCMGGQLSQALLARNEERADEIIKTHQDIFGKENYFIEIQSHPHIERDEELRNALVVIAKKHDIKLVATQDSHYPCEDDHEAHRTLLQINTGADAKDSGKFEFSEDDFSLIDTKTALKYFKGNEEAVYNSQFVADMCEEYDLELGKAYFPDYQVEDGMAPDEKLKQLAYAGFEFRKVDPKDQTYIDRLEYELGVIKQKGYATYFLVVGDLLRFARENGILTNIRGSVAGSLTTYLLGITNVDPFFYKLPFERFLNPERPSLPDIDMDFADNRRDEMIAYAKKKYGEDRVAQIGTFGTMMAKGSVRDVARALGYEYSIGDRISKMIPVGSQGFPMTIKHAMELTPELKEAYKKEEDTKKIIDLAMKMEGCVRHISVHAAGIVISPKPLQEFTPVQFDPKEGGIITQYDMYSIEEAGLPKFDFLGIRNLSILADAVRLVKKLKNVEVDLNNLPLDDKKTFAMLARGETMGLFQLNGAGMTKALVELRPTNIHDINVMVALYRPGPMDNIQEYIQRKHGKKPATYMHPKMKEFLDTTFGVLVYQDDLLMTAIHVAGYSWGEVDKFRKAVGKKIPEEMKKQHVLFVEGCMKHGGMSKEKAEAIWELFVPFQGYGFNKAHAASYGMVAFQTSYMKAHFPVEYICAILTAESGDVEKISEIVAEAKKMKIEVLPPNINESFGDFTIIQDEGEKKVIRFGFYTIKNLGTDISDVIIEERKKNGKFTSIGNFLDRIKHKNLNKKSLEALIYSGAMDEFGERGALAANVEDMLLYNKDGAKVNQNQGSLFGAIASTAAVPTFKLKEAAPMEDKEKLTWEKELLGLYISGHPLERIRDKLESKNINIKKIKEDLGNGMPVTIGGLVVSCRAITTKKDERMAFIKIEDLTGDIEAVVFPSIFKDHAALLEGQKTIALSGKVSLRNGEKSIIIEALKEI